MTLPRVAVPGTILFLTLSIPCAGQNLERARPMAVAPGTPQSVTPQEPVTVVRPELTDEQLADLYMVRKQYHEAAVIYKHLVDKDPRNAVYLNKLGIAMHQQSALAQALKYYEKAVKADPNYADAENNVGTIWYQRKKYGKAIKAYQRAIEVKSDMAVLYSNLGYAYFGDQKYQESIAAFRQALSLDPVLFERGGSRNGSVLQDRSVGDRGRFYFLLAKSFAQTGDVDRCILYLRKAKDEGYKDFDEVKKDPSFAAILKNPAIQQVLAPKPPDEPQL